MVKDPIKLGAEESLIDPTTYKPIVSGVGKNDVKNGYLIKDGDGNWKIDPTLYAAEKELKATAAPKITMSPTVRVGNTFAEGVAKQGADRLFSQVESAAAAPQIVSAANQVISSLKTGNVMAGPGTTWKIAATQIFGGDSEKLRETRKAIQGMAILTLESRQSLKGHGPITEGEQKLLEKARSGDVDNLSVGEIMLIAQGAQKNGRMIHAQGKKASSALAGMPEFKSILPAFDIQDLPEEESGYGMPPPGAVRVKGQ